MCGIFGCISKNAGNLDTPGILDILKHRGPDDSGVYLENNLLFAHVRLSIQDVSCKGHQPMSTKDGNVTLIFNGEIYNHYEIRKRLLKEFGINFNSTSDTETLLYALKYWGIEAVKLLNGIFAFAVYFMIEKTVYIVRDQFGVKPLYYYLKDNGLVFSSELKAINSLQSIDKEIDYKALVNYLNFLWSPGKRTPFKHINKLLPGHYLKIDINESLVKQVILPQSFYDIPFDGNYIYTDEAEAIDKLEELLHNAVKRQLLSDVPVGFFLSGGLDSSLILAIAGKIYPNRKWNCYTIDDGTTTTSNSDGFSNDLFYAQKVADYLDQPLKIIKGDSSIVNQIDQIVWHLDEPTADLAPIHVLNIANAASIDGIKVLLGGTAGDDLFSGYRRHVALKYDNKLSYIPSFVLAVIKRIIYFLPSRPPKIRRLKKYFSSWSPIKEERIVNYFSWLDIRMNKALFANDVQKEIEDYDPNEYLIQLLESIPEEKSELNKMLFLEMKTFLVDHNLNYTDKMSMSAGVEARVPYLDLDLVNFACHLHPDLKLKGVTTKYLLKKVAERYLPNEVIYRPKTGFGVPLREWIQNDLKPYIDDTLSEDNINKYGVFNYKTVKRMLDENNSGKQDYAYPILCLLMIQSWLKQFILKS